MISIDGTIPPGELTIWQNEWLNPQFPRVDGYHHSLRRLAAPEHSPNGAIREVGFEAHVLWRPPAASGFPDTEFGYSIALLEQKLVKFGPRDEDLVAVHQLHPYTDYDADPFQGFEDMPTNFSDYFHKDYDKYFSAVENGLVLKLRDMYDGLVDSISHRIRSPDAIEDALKRSRVKGSVEWELGAEIDNRAVLAPVLEDLSNAKPSIQAEIDDFLSHLEGPEESWASPAILASIDPGLMREVVESGLLEGKTLAVTETLW